MNAFRSFLRCTSTAFAIGIVACSSSDPENDPSPRADSALGASTLAPGLQAALVAKSFIVQPGTFEFLDMTACCATSCAGNNPSSPYGTFYIPAGPGQTAPNPKARPSDGMSNAYRLRRDEAIVYVGKTAPSAAYFGFTPYLMERTEASGNTRSVFASLSETLNHLVIRTGAPTPFERTVAIVAAADATTTSKATDALIASGVPASAINVITFDPSKSRFGLDETADTFAVLFRMALVKDAAKKAAYIEHPEATVFRITPSAQLAANALPSPASRTKATSPSELPLRLAVNRLGDAIKAAYPTHTSQALAVDDGVPDPDACIAGTATCAGDNRDTTYPGTNPRVLFANDDDFYVVYGVNHQVSGKTVYSNASVYAAEKLVGLKSVASNEYPGSAKEYLPADAQTPKLYAWKIARRCNGEAYCMEVPKGACPTGIENGKLGTITFRTYLEPSTKTAPLPSTLVADRVLVFKKR